MAAQNTPTFKEGMDALRVQAQKPPRPDRPETLPPAEIRIERSVFQPRTFEEGVREHRAHVRGLVKSLRSKPAAHRVLDPVVVAAIGDAFYCIDGHHRLAAYAELGVTTPIPVEHFSGGLEAAVSEAVARNTKDRLVMTGEEKMEAAWKLVCLGGLTKRQTVEKSGVSDGTVATMRKTFRTLQARDEADEWPTWADAKRSMKDSGVKEFTNEMRDAQVRDWCNRLGQAFGKKAFLQADVLAEAIELYSQKLPAKLIECWIDTAREVVEQDEEQDDNPDF
jgi:hypothetical protein